MDATTFELPAVLDLKATGPLAEKFLGLRGQNVVIDASKVERVGTQCVQILLSAAATWKDDMAPLAIANPSDAFTAGLKLLGLSPETVMEKDIAQ